MRVLNGSTRHTGEFCSVKCRNVHIAEINREFPVSNLFCVNCNASFTRKQSQLKKSKNLFCSQSCAATYNNTNKTYGVRRSKLEICLEKKLLEHYPNLKFQFNKKDIIESELDVFIPLYKLAFEINGIFHYEPIYGAEKLSKIQNNDLKKIVDCRKSDIHLHIIDTSHVKHISEKIITDIFLQLKDIIDKF